MVTLTVVNSAVQRGTNIRDSNDKGEGAAPLAQALCTRQREQVLRMSLAQAPCARRQVQEQRVSLVNHTRLIGPQTFAPFRKIDENSGGSVSCNTQPNFRTS